MNFQQVNISAEAAGIAEDHAALAGKSLAQWLTEAINAHAAAQTPRVEIPVDDCGFYSPPHYENHRAA